MYSRRDVQNTKKRNNTIKGHFQKKKRKESTTPILSVGVYSFLYFKCLQNRFYHSRILLIPHILWKVIKSCFFYCFVYISCCSFIFVFTFFKLLIHVILLKTPFLQSIHFFNALHCSSSPIIFWKCCRINHFQVLKAKNFFYLISHWLLLCVCRFSRKTIKWKWKFAIIRSQRGETIFHSILQKFRVIF